MRHEEPAFCGLSLAGPPARCCKLVLLFFVDLREESLSIVFSFYAFNRFSGGSFFWSGFLFEPLPPRSESRLRLDFVVGLLVPFDASPCCGGGGSLFPSSPSSPLSYPVIFSSLSFNLFGFAERLGGVVFCSPESLAAQKRRGSLFLCLFTSPRSPLHRN